jgi:hypothetical protein
MVHDLSDQCSTLYLIFGKEKTFIDQSIPLSLDGRGLALWSNETYSTGWR